MTTVPGLCGHRSSKAEACLLHEPEGRLGNVSVSDLRESLWDKDKIYHVPERKTRERENRL